jgi:eukaryotic-like serine/threonine-protein kinase
VERRQVVGQVLDGRYFLLEPIGRGAMGSVYRAEDKKLGRIVAVKMMNQQVPDEMAARRRFEREAAAMAKLEHPHCASIVDVGMHDDQPYVVMDYVRGESLDSVVAQGPLPIARAVEITRQILSGLAHAHELGIIHRDIKPANIMLSQRSGIGDHVKILDFGLVKLTLGETSSNLTAGVVVGTPSYMAPEQIRGLALDRRVDVYACGVLLFELLTGAKPFRAENNEPFAICMKHLNEPVPQLADLMPYREFGALEEVVAHALAKDRDLRFATATAFANALAAATAPVAAPPRPPPPPVEATIPISDTDVQPPRPSHALRYVVLGGAALAAITTAVVLSAAGGEATPARSAPRPPPVVAASKPVALPAPAPAPPPAPEPPGPPAETVADTAPDPVAALVARVDNLGRESAIELLVKARKTYPRDARLAYHAGLLYLDKMWWGEGLKQLRAAIDLDPAYRSDPALIDAAVRAFGATARYDWTLAKFLHDDLGATAKSALENTANHHKNPIVRARAAAELRRYR